MPENDGGSLLNETEGSRYSERDESMIDELSRAIKAESEDYQPAEDIVEVIKETSFVALVGPTGVGKTTIMHTVNTLDGDFGIVQSFTTRPIKPGESEDAFRFKPHDIDSLSEILDLTKKRRLVQVAVHPTTGYIYGSEAIDYTNKYSMLETLSNEVDELRKLPFDDFRVIGIATLPIFWRTRLAEQQQAIGKEYVDKRIIEGITSLEWLIDQAEAVNWVVNRDGELNETAVLLQRLVKNEVASSPYNGRIGAILLDYIKRLRDGIDKL